MQSKFVHELVKGCQEWHELLSANSSLFYSRFDVSPPADSAAIETLEATFGQKADPALVAFWSVCAALDFEWFVKQRAIQTAGIDSRVAPSGHFRVLSTEEAMKERDFLLSLGTGGDDALPHLLPFGRVGSGGELLVINHHEPNRFTVEMVLLDIELNRIPLGDGFAAWLQERFEVCFEDSQLLPDQPLAELTSLVLDGMRSGHLEWPPPQLRKAFGSID